MPGSVLQLLQYSLATTHGHRTARSCSCTTKTLLRLKTYARCRPFGWWQQQRPCCAGYLVLRGMLPPSFVFLSRLLLSRYGKLRQRALTSATGQLPPDAYICRRVFASRWLDQHVRRQNGPFVSGRWISRSLSLSLSLSQAAAPKPQPCRAVCWDLCTVGACYGCYGAGELCTTLSLHLEFRLLSCPCEVGALLEELVERVPSLRPAQARKCNAQAENVKVHKG